MTETASFSEGAAALRGRTLAEKVWDDHLVKKGGDGAPDLLFIDLHLVHEVTSPQAFDGLRVAGRPGGRPGLITPAQAGRAPRAPARPSPSRRGPTAPRAKTSPSRSPP